VIYIDDNIDDFNLQQALAMVSPQRREQALRYRRPHDQRLSIAAYRLLQRALLAECGLNEVPQFTFTPNGKPLLLGHEQVHFSLSHCSAAVTCAISDRPVGIDIETLDHYSEEIAARVMSDDECRHIMTAASPAMAFTRLWTMKESLYKLTGDDAGGDIAHMLDNVEAYRFTTIVLPSCVVTACSNK